MRGRFLRRADRPTVITEGPRRTPRIEAWAQLAVLYALWITQRSRGVRFDPYWSRNKNWCSMHGWHYHYLCIHCWRSPKETE